MKLAFKYKKIEFYGGKVKHVGLNAPWNLVIQLDDRYDWKESDIIVPESLKQTFSVVNETAQTETLLLPTKNYSYPAVSKRFWIALISDIKKSYGEAGSTRIAVCCEGGHGRTGTVLAILKTFLSGSKADPIHSIRESYDKDAVESREQAAYIEMITGIQCKR